MVTNHDSMHESMENESMDSNEKPIDESMESNSETKDGSIKVFIELSTSNTESMGSIHVIQ